MQSGTEEYPVPPDELFARCASAVRDAISDGVADQSTGPRLLFVIPHCFNPGAGTGTRSSTSAPKTRSSALARSVATLHQAFGVHQYSIDVSQSDVTAQPVSDPMRGSVDVVICTTRGLHLLQDPLLPGDAYTHSERDVEPELLGFECRTVLADAFGEYDYYCFLEDDVMVSDPLFFVKLGWFNDCTGTMALLQPNSFERSLENGGCRVVHGALPVSWSSPFQDVTTRPTLSLSALGRSFVFRRPTNPHAQSYFLDGDQLARWMGHPSFLDRSTSFIGPLESAATLGIMQTFEVYKPARENASFLEVEHLDPLIFPAGDDR
jgi:hypothetical protein